MTEDEKIIAHIKKLEQELKDGVSNAWIESDYHNTIKILTDELIKKHGYKDETSVREKVDALFRDEEKAFLEKQEAFEKSEAEQARKEKMQEVKETVEEIFSRKRNNGLSH